MSKRVLTLVLAFAMILGSFSFVAAADFTDVPADYYAIEAIEALSAKGIIKGHGDGTFTPNNSVRRAEFAAMVNRAMEFETAGDVEFTDVHADDWFYNDVAIAVEAEFIQGHGGEGEGTFTPLSPVTREQAATMIGRALNLEESEVATEFTDADEISSWAVGYVNAAAELGILEGYPEGDFKPGVNITRAQAAIVIYRALGVELEDEDEELEVVSVSAIDATTIEVTLSDGSTVTQKLDTPLKDGVETIVTIEYDNSQRKVTWNKLVSEKLEDAKEELAQAEEALEEAKQDAKDKKAAEDKAARELREAEKALEVAKEFGTDEEVKAAEKVVTDAAKKWNDAVKDREAADKEVADLETEIAQLEYEVSALEAEAAVEKAEETFEQADVDAAQKLVNVLAGPAGAQKEPLRERLNAVEEVISLIERAQDGINNLPEAKDVTLDHKVQIEGARGRVDNLPEAAQDKLEDVDFLVAAEEALAKLVDEKAIADAEKRVKLAEDAIEDENYEEAQKQHKNAKSWVALVEDEEAKKDFEDRLEAVQNAIDEAAAEAKVRNAENNKTQPAIDNAQKLIDELDDGDVKDALQARLDKVQKELNEAAAEAKVGAAEYYINNEDFIAAKTLYDEAVELVKALDEGEVKTDLLERLAEVEEAIAQAEVDAMVNSFWAKKITHGGKEQWSVGLTFSEIAIKDLDSLVIALYAGETKIGEQEATQANLELERKDATAATSPFYTDQTEDEFWTKNMDLLSGTPDKLVVTFEIDGETYTIESTDVR